MGINDLTLLGGRGRNPSAFTRNDARVTSNRSPRSGAVPIRIANRYAAADMRKRTKRDGVKRTGESSSWTVRAGWCRPYQIV